MALPPIDLSSGSALRIEVDSLVVRYTGAQNLAFETTLNTAVGYAGTPSDPGGGERLMTYGTNFLVGMAKDRDGLVDLLASLARAEQFGVLVVNAVVTFLI